MYAKHFKRFFDFSLSLTTLIVLSPLLLVIAVLVRIKLGRPVIFKQNRAGKGEQIFTIYKFRTMTNNRDKNGIVLSDELRLTKFGNVLRELSIDEFLSFFNILRGEMSIVGPRPLLADYLPLYDEVQKRRHDVRPGLTGLAQVNGRNAIDWDTRLRYDVEYIHNVTLINDIKIIFKTIAVVFSRKGISGINSMIIDPPTAKENVTSNDFFSISDDDIAKNLLNGKATVRDFLHK